MGFIRTLIYATLVSTKVREAIQLDALKKISEKKKK